jgi:hypothetical protein
MGAWFSRPTVVVIGLLGFGSMGLLPAAARAQDFAAPGLGVEALCQAYETAEATDEAPIRLATCLAVLDEDAQDMPPKKAPEKVKRKVKLKPKPMNGPELIMDPVETIEAGAAEDYGCADCAAPCASCASCYYRPYRPFYVALSGGFAHRETVHEVDDARTFIEFDEGFATNLALGYRCWVFRFEAEYTFMNNEVETAGAAGLSSPAAGNVNLRAWMFNVYHST